MSDNARTLRLSEDLRTLQALRDESTIFEFVADDGDPADQFTLIFRGKGIRRDRNADEGYEEVGEHRCEIRMGSAYPDQVPDLRWLTPAYHPNITYSGFISLKDLGLPWDKAVGLDVVCERLWDAARLAYFDLDRASNYNAKNWFETEAKLELPVDVRPLRDGPSEQIDAGGNVVRYRRKSDEPLSIVENEPSSRGDVFFLEDPPQAIVYESPIRHRGSPTSQDGDDILFIE